MIGTRLNSIMLVSALAVFLTGAALYHSVRQVREESAMVEVLDEISKGAFELFILADEYGRMQEEQQRRQWRLRRDSLAFLMTQLDSFNDREGGAVVRQMHEIFSSLESVFANWRGASQPLEGNGGQAELKGDLLALIQGLDDNARQLHAASHERLQADWQRAGLVIVFLVLIMLAGLLAIRDALKREMAERRRAEGKIVESEEHIRLLLNSTAEGIYGLDPEGRCTFCNASCLRMLGYELEGDLLGCNMHELIHHTRADGAPYPAEECRTHGVYRGEAVHEEDEIFWRRDGSGLPVEYWAHPVSKAGAVVGVVVTFVDITMRKAADERLRLAMTVLQRSNQELERFAYVASHDLQEPLRMVSSYVQLLAEEYGGKLGQEADVYIGFATDGAARMQQMINDLLLYSRVRTRGNPLAPVDLEAVLASVLDNLQLAIKESRAVITHEPLPTVVADGPQLTQVFQNILGNSIKFRGEEPPRIQVSASRKDDSWLFAIRDNGIGFDPSQAERVFQVFQSLHARAKYPGTGIGLSICKRVVERHGGVIWAESEPGRGSTFCFTIPDHKEA